MTADELIKVMEKFKELGLKSFEVDGIKMESHQNSNSSEALARLMKKEPPPDLEAKDIVAPMSVFDDLDEEEVMYWSTPYYDEIRAKKEAMKEAKKNEVSNSKNKQN